MSTDATQTGPRLTITASCEGCEHRTWSANTSPVVALQSHRVCAHPSMGRRALLDASTPPTCPELPAARLALDLLPPTFTARFAEALYASDDGKGSGALHALLAEVGGTPYDPENDPRYNGAGTATKKGGKR
jgi:hypothetical protein